MTQLVVTVVGTDRPGLMELLSDAVAAHGGNWLESRLTRLGGQFAGMALIDIPEDRVSAVRESLRQLGDKGLSVQVTDSGSGGSTEGGGLSATLTVVGNDRPGIVRRVSSVLAAGSVNVEDFATDCSNAPISGGTIFRATARLRVPSDASLTDLQNQLEQIAADLMVDISLEQSS